MIEMNGKEYFDELRTLLDTTELTLSAKYRRARFLFERLCKQVTAEEQTQFPNLFSRLSWINQHLLGSEKELGRELNGLRVRLNKIVREELSAESDDLRADILTIGFAVRKLLVTPFPEFFLLLEKSIHRKRKADTRLAEVQVRMRARFVRRENDDLYVVPEESESDQEVRVRINREHSGIQLFAETLEVIHEGAQLNLLNVRDHFNDCSLTADLVVLEPDFLLDISTIAECFRDYGHHPLNYFMSRLSPDQNTHHILLGNIANQFLDDIVNETADNPADYLVSMSKAFRQSPVSIAACETLNDPAGEKKFFNETKQQFWFIQNVVREHFPKAGIDSSKALLEPSFVCEALGIQGRLDLLQEDFSKFVELKSGKANENFYTKEVSHKENHYVQMMLYYAVLQFNLGKAADQIDAFLLYSKYPVLYGMAPYWGLVKQAIDLRNQIVGLEYRIQQHNDPEYSRQILATINADTLNTAVRKDKLWNQYQKPQIDNFAYQLSVMSPIENDYYHALFTFITKEQYTTKAGDTESEFNKGITSLWNATLEEKEEAGEIIRDMRLFRTEVIGDKHLLTFSLPAGDDTNLPNYRTGDSVMLYQRNQLSDQVTNRQVFKGAVDAIDAHTLTLSLRAIQKNESVLPMDALYAIERDYMDTSYASMLKGLAQFLYATPERKSLLLGQRKPRVDRSAGFSAKDDSDVERVVRKAVEAQDYFLLVGPPGTGKTSCALRRMVETFYSNPGQNILLLAYTNKAVDEICHSLTSIDDNFPFVRIGQESACEEDFKPRLLRNVMADCLRRKDVRKRLEECRVFVGTVASFARQTELFRLKDFDVAIIDEATQILEPQLLGLLCATNVVGRDAIRKFILIGDYKQLPAVVVQSDKSAAIQSELLSGIGMRNLKESLFERLYRWEQTCGREECCDMLTRQGRMHPDISAFPARYFYHGKLSVVPLKHQEEVWDDKEVSTCDLDAMVRSKRFVFFPVEKSNRLTSNKLNPQEASLVGRLIDSWYRQKTEAGEVVSLADEVGVITPYRSQIAMIRKELQLREIPDADRIVIDTVERFQGGQRNLMIYSCCMNAPYQLNFLSNTIEEEGKVIDRKLNVALTRARIQMFIVGNPAVLRRDPIYHQLLEYIRQTDSYYLGRYD
ncbi:MAG: AAA domain-containing protein [Bacteroidales bacterium]